MNEKKNEIELDKKIRENFKNKEPYALFIDSPDSKVSRAEAWNKAFIVIKGQIRLFREVLRLHDTNLKEWLSEPCALLTDFIGYEPEIQLDVKTSVGDYGVLFGDLVISIQESIRADPDSEGEEMFERDHGWITTHFSLNHLRASSHEEYNVYRTFSVLPMGVYVEEQSSVEEADLKVSPAQFYAVVVKDLFPIYEAARKVALWDLKDGIILSRDL